MQSLTTDLLNVLGEHAGSPAVTSIVQNYIYDDPPFRRYIGSNALGLDLLFNEDTLIDVQLHIKPTTHTQAFKGTLPLGLEKGMTKSAVHQFLGQPERSSESHSVYLMSEPRVQLVIEYTAAGEMRYVSIAVLKKT